MSSGIEKKQPNEDSLLRHASGGNGDSGGSDSGYTPDMFGKVAVLMGGQSAEREVSLQSGDGVLRALQSRGVDAHVFDPALEPLYDLVEQGYDRCFITLHGRWGEDGTVQGALELLGLPYTGSGVMASALAMNKAVTKKVWRADGLSTPEWRCVSGAQGVQQAFAELGAMVVKPMHEGSSIGVAKVYTEQQCEQAFAQAREHDHMLLCEQLVQGQEYTVAVLGSGDKAHALPVIRIIAPEGNFDYENKYVSDDTQYLLPCGLASADEAAMQELVVRAYNSIECTGWARADVMVCEKTGTPYLIEINTAPGMTSHSLVPRAAAAQGIEYADLCLYILADTLRQSAVLRRGAS